MLFTLKERFVLLDLLYEIDRYIPLSDLRRFYGQVYISAEEIEDKGVYALDGNYGWKKDDGWEIDVPPSIEKLIRRLLTRLNEDGELDTESERLYALFCGVE